MGTRCRAFPAYRRLRRRPEFRAVYDGGVRAGARLVTVFALSARFAGPARVGLTVTRRVGNAVIRNRAKRALREAVRLHWDKLPDGLHIILHAKPRIARARAEDIEDEVIRMLRRAVARVRHCA